MKTHMHTHTHTQTHLRFRFLQSFVFVFATIFISSPPNSGTLSHTLTNENKLMPEYNKNYLFVVVGVVFIQFHPLQSLSVNLTFVPFCTFRISLSVSLANKRKQIERFSFFFLFLFALYFGFLFSFRSKLIYGFEQVIELFVKLYSVFPLIPHHSELPLESHPHTPYHCNDNGCHAMTNCFPPAFLVIKPKSKITNVQQRQQRGQQHKMGKLNKNKKNHRNCSF